MQYNIDKEREKKYEQMHLPLCREDSLQDI